MNCNSYKFFANKDCEYYPCHNGISEMNCLFCYCPLYLHENCPGKPEYIEANDVKIKDCSNCTFPHEAGNYETMMKFLTHQNTRRD